MRSKKLNVYELQYEWMKDHAKADTLVFDDDKVLVEARYKSPLEQWKGLIGPDGCVNVPDMDFYNSLPSYLIEQGLEQIERDFFNR